MRELHETERARTFWCCILADTLVHAAGAWIEYLRSERRRSVDTKGTRMDALLKDLRYAWRTLSRHPAFAILAVTTLALGIGANTAIFSLVKAVMLVPLPYGTPERLVIPWGRLERSAITHLSGPEVRDYAALTDVFKDVAAYTGSVAILTGGAEPERVVAADVSPNIFNTLGAPPLVGRTFDPSDNPRAIADHIVISYSLWQRRFGGSRDAVGSRILVDGKQTLVIGVMPSTFRLPLDFGDDRPSELWWPLDVRAPEWGAWGNHSLTGVARLEQSVSAVRATAAMRQLEDRWIRDRVGGGWNDHDVVRRSAVPLKDLVVGDVSAGLWMLLGAVGVMLIITCANVANLTLAKADERHREIAVRIAMGASRTRIVRQLLTESVLLSACGGAVGIGVADAAMRALIAARPPGIPRIEQMELDTGVLLFAVAVSLATAVFFGVAPAVELSRGDLNAPLKESGWTGSVGRTSQRFRDALAVTQVALSVILLIGALLLIRSLVGLRGIDLGFRPDGAMTARMTLPMPTYAKDADAIGTVRTLRRRIADLADVQAVGATRLVPLTGTIGNWSITQEDRPRRPGENPNGDWQVVTPGYFEAMGIPLVRGRFLAESDDEHAPIVALISETMAAKYWPGEDAIGKRFRAGGVERPWISIVGVVGHVRHNTLTERPRAEMYVPHAQWGLAGGSTRRAMTFVIRTGADPLRVLPRVREAVRAIDPNLPISEVARLDQITADALSEARFTTALLGLFGALALTLATVGIYGVISLLVARRRREIGIRMALGARSTTILGMVVARGIALVGVGVILGLAAASALTRVIANLLFGVTPLDPVTFAAVPCVLSFVALLACVIPARRAARLNPMTALRQE